MLVRDTHFHHMISAAICLDHEVVTLDYGRNLRAQPRRRNEKSCRAWELETGKSRVGCVTGITMTGDLLRILRSPANC
jgi:hypothetical protein